MKKILLVILSFSATAAFAGRGAVLVIDNSTDTNNKTSGLVLKYRTWNLRI